MIKYRLRCEHDHEFEGWFRRGADYDVQAAGGLLSCGQCGSRRIEKALMAPNVTPSDKRATPTAASETSAAPAPAATSPMPEAMAAGMPPQVLEMARRIRAHLREHAENVGPRFAEEARRIHYNEAEPRGIYGQASPREAMELSEEGIEVHSLPSLPDDAN